jgi:subtilisin family serine protease
MSPGYATGSIDTGIDYNHEDLAGNIGRDLDNNIGRNITGADPNDPMDTAPMSQGP